MMARFRCFGLGSRILLMLSIVYVVGAERRLINLSDIHSIPSSERPDNEAGDHLLALRNQLLRYCEVLSGSRSEAEDVVQITMLKALPVLQGAKPHPNVVALLQRIAKNTWIDIIRKQNKYRQFADSELPGVWDQTSLENQAEVEMALQVILQNLTPQQRTVFLMCDVFQYTDREAGELLGISQGAVKAALHRAKVRLNLMVSSDRQLIGYEEVQRELLHAYVEAFREGDIKTLISLWQGGAWDTVPTCLAAA